MPRKTSALAALFIVLCGAAQAGDVAISGFLSVGGGYVDDEAHSRNGYTEEDFTFDQDSLLGLQVSANISDKATVTAQITGRGKDDWQAETSWAYFAYQVTDNFQWRMGRVRVPFYFYSDFIDVGYAYAWISPPQELYSLPFDNIEGVDALWNTSLGSVDVLVQGYYGATHWVDSFSPDSTSRDQLGVVLQLSSGWFQGRLAHHQADVNSPNQDITDLSDAVAFAGFSANADQVKVEDDPFTFDGVAVMMDSGRFLAGFEQTILESNDETPIAKEIRSYFMAGVRFGDFLVHVTKSRRRDEAADLSSGIPAGQANPVFGDTDTLIGILDGLTEDQVSDTDAKTIGLRWDFTSSAAFKVEYTKQDDNRPSDNNVKLVRFAIQSVF